MVKIMREEDTTGVPGKRTPREEFIPVYTEGDLVEIDWSFDGSESEGWLLPTIGGPLWPVQMEAARQVVAIAQDMDSQAKKEQAGGDDSHGGFYSAGFNHELIKVWAGPYDLKFNPEREQDDGGDLNLSNWEEKISALHTRHGEKVPSGGTSITSTVVYLDQHYLGEFRVEEKTGLVVPVAKRPRRARFVSTDGAMKDYKQFGRRLVEDHSEDWPDEEWFISIGGEETGDGRHDAAIALYQEAAEAHKNVHVYVFTGVANPAEVAEDMAVAMLPQSA